MDGEAPERLNQGNVELAFATWRTRPGIPWSKAISPSFWVISLMLFAAGLSVCSYVVSSSIHGLQAAGIGTGLAAMWENGFGINPTMVAGDLPGSLSDIDRSGTTALLANILIANSPQVMVSFLYIFYNSILTRQLVADEFVRFLREDVKKALRVSFPVGMQRSSHFLSLPFSIFLVQSSAFSAGPDGQRLQMCDYSARGYTVSGGISAIVFGSAALIALLCNSLFRRYREIPPGFQRMGFHSIAIQAICQRPKEDADAAFFPVRIGVSMNTGGGAQVVFSTDTELQVPRNGQTYLQPVFVNRADAWTPSSISTGSLETDNILQDVLMLVRNELPYVQSEFLKYHSRLGAGTSFEVNKELFGLTGESPYFVAVKRIVMDRVPGGTKQTAEQVKQSSKRLINVKREVRVLTHPKLRSHSCLISAIAWGWDPDLTFGNRPYLVMPYSPHGTLAAFAQRRSLNLIDRRLMTLDVAMGIRALHDCDIVHGDVKPENVLVYGYLARDQDNERHYLAKLADFGCTLFKQDVEQQHEYYLGTPKYNAPEISGWTKETDEESLVGPIQKFAECKAADCYSFGLVLWETIKHAKSFIEPDWLNAGENALTFLERAFFSSENAILKLAMEFLRSQDSNITTSGEKDSQPAAGVYPYPSNPTTAELNGYFGRWTHLRDGLEAIGAPPDSQSFRAFESTLSLSLQENVSLRGNIHQIIEALSEGIEESPYMEDRYEKVLAPTMEVSPITRAVFLDKGAHTCSSAKNLRVVPRDEPADPSLQVTRVTAQKRCETLVLTPQAYRYKSEDMFMVSIEDLEVKKPN
ncbi:tkl protein kinase [Fusarium langsethiae]|uniref:Tkl protein kinase n=1 Tax=Fusarium langsethiae TaxID=179993 RepID=A0A0M9EVL4_FUSLA|nr:tkl protein kinase [Fusarium langsethiae]